MKRRKMNVICQNQPLLPRYVAGVTHGPHCGCRPSGDVVFAFQPSPPFLVNQQRMRRCHPLTVAVAATEHPMLVLPPFASAGAATAPHRGWLPPVVSLPSNTTVRSDPSHVPPSRCRHCSDEKLRAAVTTIPVTIASLSPRRQNLQTPQPDRRFHHRR